MPNPRSPQRQQQQQCRSNRNTTAKSPFSPAPSVVRFKTSSTNTVYDVLQRRPGWVEADGDDGEHATDDVASNRDDDWDLMWADRDRVYDVFDRNRLGKHQRINHFRNARELCRKDLLAKNLKKQRRKLLKGGSDNNHNYDFFPVTFALPKEYALFVQEFKKRGGLWIMKPVGAAQGKGIFLFSKLSDVSDWKNHGPALAAAGGGGGKKGKQQRHPNDAANAEAYVVQKYVENPYLIGGKKFDLRLYVLVTSFSPLTIWLYRSGFARFANALYSKDPSDVRNSVVHLTNVSVQRRAAARQGDHDHDRCNDDQHYRRTGGKWELRKLKTHMMGRFGTSVVDSLFHELQTIVCRSLESVESVMIHDRRCFELYGYDVLIDEDLKPWLIEVNASPSLTANTEEDAKLKFRMLNDALDVVDVEGVRSGDETVVGGFDLVYKGGAVGKSELLADQGWSTCLGGLVP